MRSPSRRLRRQHVARGGRGGAGGDADQLPGIARSRDEMVTILLPKEFTGVSQFLHRL